MSLDVAIQSVVFYVLSCSTCSKINHRRKAKLQAKKDRAEKEQFESEQPGLYRHPSPFSTNPYWTEEIMMGPGPPKKNGDKSSWKNGSQQALNNNGGQGSSYAGSTAMGTELSSTSSPTAVTEGSRLSGDGWNRTRYQREDEALWGLDFQGPVQKITDAIAKAGSSASRLLESRLSKSGDGARDENPGTYYEGRNPPVNDLHPPVVSTQPTSRDQTRWMLQPPPSAKVMEGKERVTTRSRAGSNGSSRKGTDEPPLSRQVTGRLVDAKIQRGESPFADGVIATPKRTKTRSSRASRSQRHDRHRSSSADSISSSEGTMRRKHRPRGVSVNTSSSSSRDAIEHLPAHSAPISRPPGSAGSDIRESATRPALPTILSSTNSLSRDAKIQKPLREISVPSTSNQLNAQPKSPPLTRQSSAGTNAVSASVVSNNDEANPPTDAMKRVAHSPLSENNEPAGLIPDR